MFPAIPPIGPSMEPKPIPRTAEPPELDAGDEPNGPILYSSDAWRRVSWHWTDAIVFEVAVEQKFWL